MSGTLPAPVQKRVRSLADQVYERLRADIITGRLAPNARIVELEVAQAVGTSQGPVRETLQRLEREGLVRRRAHSATFVTRVSNDEIYELFCIRAVIEGFAVKRAVRQITDDQIAQLDGLVSKMRDEGQRGDMMALTDHDLLFHRHICQWSGSPTLLRAWDPLYGQIQRFVVQTHRGYFHELTEIADTHLPVLATLRRREPEEAAQVLQDHIMLIWYRVEQIRA
jgi:DNA-binding GntR family transcriptional regulator